MVEKSRHNVNGGIGNKNKENEKRHPLRARLVSRLGNNYAIYNCEAYVQMQNKPVAENLICDHTIFFVTD